MEKIRKTSNVIYKALGILFWLGLIVMSLGILITGLGLLLRADGKLEFEEWSYGFGVLELSFASGVLPERFQWFDVTLLISYAIDMVFGLLCIRLLRNIFKPMTEGLPFSHAVSTNLRKMAFLELAFGILATVENTVIQTLFFRKIDLPSLLVSEKVTDCSLNMKMDVSFLVTFVILLLLSYVFRYGAELQQLSDETI